MSTLDRRSILCVCCVAALEMGTPERTFALPPDAGVSAPLLNADEDLELARYIELLENFDMFENLPMLELFPILEDEDEH